MTTPIGLSSRLKTRKLSLTPEQTAAMKSAERSSDWLWQQPPDELRKYINKTVAIYEREVVAVANSRSELAPMIAHLDRSWVYVISFPFQSRIRIQRP